MDIYIQKYTNMYRTKCWRERKKTRLHCSWRVLMKCIRIYRWMFNCSFHKTSDGLQFETDCWTNIGYFLKLLLFFFLRHLQCDTDCRNCELWSRKKKKSKDNFKLHRKFKIKRKKKHASHSEFKYFDSWWQRNESKYHTNNFKKLLVNDKEQIIQGKTIWMDTVT